MFRPGGGEEFLNSFFCATKFVLCGKGSLVFLS